MANKSGYSPAALAFRERYEGNVKAGMSKGEAMRRAVVDDPTGHQAYIDDHSSKYGDTDSARQTLVGRTEQLP